MNNSYLTNANPNVLFVKGSDMFLSQIVRDSAKWLYGYNDKIPDDVSEKLEKELKYIKESGIATVFITALKLIVYSEKISNHHKKEFNIKAQINVDTPLVAYFMGITQECPLPPHYICFYCRYSDFHIKDTVQSGCELPKKICPNCNKELNAKGSISHKFIQPMYTNNQKFIVLSFSSNIKQEILYYIDVLIGKENRDKTGIEIVFC